MNNNEILLEKKIEIIEKKLDYIIKLCEKMDNHVTYVDSIIAQSTILRNILPDKNAYIIYDKKEG